MLRIFERVAAFVKWFDKLTGDVEFICLLNSGGDPYNEKELTSRSTLCLSTYEIGGFLDTTPGQENLWALHPFRFVSFETPRVRAPRILCCR